VISFPAVETFSVYTRHPRLPPTDTHNAEAWKSQARLKDTVLQRYHSEVWNHASEVAGRDERDGSFSQLKSHHF